MAVDLSIIIPVLNEKHTINAAIKRLFEQAFSRTLEIIVVDGSPLGDTLACIKYDKVIPIISLPGRGRQMNAGAFAAKGSILLFLHCDTALPKNALEKIVHKMEKEDCDAGAFDLSIDAAGFAYRMIEKNSIHSIPFN